MRESFFLIKFRRKNTFFNRTPPVAASESLSETCNKFVKANKREATKIVFYLITMNKPLQTIPISQWESNCSKSTNSGINFFKVNHKTTNMLSLLLNFGQIFRLHDLSLWWFRVAFSNVSGAEIEHARFFTSFEQAQICSKSKLWCWTGIYYLG